MRCALLISLLAMACGGGGAAAPATAPPGNTSPDQTPASAQASCANAAERIAGSGSFTDMSVELRAALQGDLERVCVDDGWAASQRTCFASILPGGEIAACVAELPDEQQEGFIRVHMKTMQAHMDSAGS